MAITRYAGDRFTVNTSDTKPTGVLDGAYLIDTGNLTQWVRRTAGGTSQWNQLAGGGGGGGTPGGANTQVQFNNAGAFGGDADLTFTNGNRLNVNKLGISGNIYDSNNSIGEGGMVLTNEGTTGVNWKNIESVLSGVGGSGVANYVARWSDEDTITSGVIQDDGTAVGINQAADPDNALAIKSIANNTNPLQIAAHDGDSLLVFRQTAGDGRLSIKKDGGVETIRLDSDNVSYINGGNFGLGTAAPAAPLDVQSANGDSVGIRVTNGYKMQFLNGSNNTNSNIYNNGASGVAQLDFQIAGATKVTIDNDGDVGIGTTTPSAKLFIKGDSTSRAFHAVGSSTTAAVGYFYTNEVHTGTTTNAAVSIRSDHASSTGQILHVRGDGSGDLLTLDQGGTSRVVVKADGDVDILNRLGVGGAHSGSYGLYVHGTSYFDEVVSLGSGSMLRRYESAWTNATTHDVLLSSWYSALGDYLYLKVPGNSVSNHGAIVISDGLGTFFGHTDVEIGPITNSGTAPLTTTHARIGATSFFNGSVGIGTTDPGGKLESYITSGGEKGLRLNSNFAGGNTVDFIPAIVGVSNAGFSIDLAGTNRFVINSGGNVGIGTNAPTRKLEVIETTNAAAATFETRENGGIAAVELRARDLSAPTVALPSGQGPALTFQGFSGSTFQTMATIFASTEATAANNDVPSSLLFLTTPDGAAAATEKMRIKSDGKVGIGTASPTHKLEVIGNSYIDATAGSPTLSLGRYSGQPSIKAASDDGGYLLMDSNGGRAGLNWYSSDHVVLANGGGHVGIGTDAPTEKLDVEGSLVLNVATGTGLGEEGIFFRRGFSDSNKYNISILAYAHDGAGNFSDGISINGYDGVSFCTGSNTRQERMRIVGGTGATSGYVGIGTTAPLGKLHVYGGQVRILDSTASPSYGARLVVGRDTAQDIEFHVDDLNCKIVADQDSDSNGNHNFILDRSFAGNGDNNFQIQKGGSSQFLINTDGNVGINNTSPEHRLHVAGDAIISGYLYDSTNSTGVDGYVLTSKEDGPQWKMIEDVLSGVGGNGTANYIPKWEDEDTIGDSVIAQSGTAIGIGTAAPATSLEVLAADPVLTVRDTEATVANASATLRLAESSATNTLNGHFDLKFAGSASGGDLDISRYNNTSLVAQGVRIRHDGNVGIAITDPDEKLEVDGNIKIGSDKFYRMGGDAFQIGADGSSVGMHFHAGGSERMTLLAGGNVGIGVTSANAKLKVVTSNTDIAIFQGTHATTTNFYISNSNATANNTANLYFAPANKVAGALIQAIAIEDFSTSANRTADLAFQTRKDGTFAEHMRIDSSGLVGIGTNNPSAYDGNADDLVVQTGGETGITIRSSSTAGGNIFFADGTSGDQRYRGIITYSHNSDQFIFSTAASNRLTILNDGQIKFNNYGSGTHTGTAAYRLMVDSSGNVIEGNLGAGVVDGSGTTNYIARWSDTDTIGNSNIFDNGTIGIGTAANLNGKVTIREAGNSGTPNHIFCMLSSAAVGHGAAIFLKTSTSNTNNRYGARIRAIRNDNNNAAADLAFSLENTAASAVEEMVRFTSDGNVGIGTDDPADILSIQVPSSTTKGIFFQDGSTSTYGTKLKYEELTNNFYIEQVENNVQTGILTIKRADGSVGIGTTNPIYTLHVKAAEGIVRTDSTTGTNRSGFQMANTGGTGFIMATSSAGNGVLTTGGLAYALQINKSGGSTDAWNAVQIGTKDIARMTIDESGNVGIGTNNPTGKFQIGANYTIPGTSYGGDDIYIANTASHSNYDPSVTSTDDFRALITISDGTTTGPIKPGLILYNDDTTAGGFSPMLLFAKRETGASPYKAATAAIYARSPLGTGNSNSWIDGELIFATAGAATQGIRQRMVINKEGLVGIGTNNPSRELEVHGSGNVYARITASTDNDSAALELNNNGNELWTLKADDTANDYFKITNDAGTALTIDTSKNVGIGTTSPSNKLVVVNSDTDTTPTALLQNSSTGDASLHFNISGRSYTIGIDNSDGDKFKISRNNGLGTTDRLTINGDGSVGIGINSPDSQLHVLGDTLKLERANNAPAFKLYNNSASPADDAALGYLQFTGKDNNGTANMVYSEVRGGVQSNTNSAVSGYLSFLTTNNGTAVTEAMRIKADGSVGIATTNPAAKLDVRGNILRSGLTFSSWTSRSINTLTQAGATINYILIAPKTTINVRLSGRFNCARSNGVSAVSIAHADVVFCTDNDANPQSGGIHSASSDIPSYGHANFEIVELEYSSTEYYALKISPSASWTAAFAQIEFEGISNNVTWTNIDSGNVSNVGAFGGSQAVFAYKHANVGIGTDSPSARLHITSDGSHDEGAEIVLRHANNNSTDVVSTLSFQNNGGQVAMIQAGTTSGNTNGYISLFTDNSGTSAEKMRIISDGNIGIGTTDPGVTLDVRGKLSIGSPNTSYDLYNNGTTYLNGNVTVDATLSVTGGVAGVSVINSSTTDSAGADSYLNIFKTAGSGGGSRATLRVGYDATACFQISRIRNNANIYINSRQSGSAMVFQIQDTEKMNLTSSALTFVSGHQLRWGDSSTYITGSNSSDFLQFYPNGSVQLTLNSSGATIENDLIVDGSVGIGTTNPGSYKLLVNGNSYLDGTAYVDGLLTVDGDIDLESAGQYITFYGNSSADHSISSRNSSGNAADDLRINTYGALFINLDSNGNNTSGADFSIGRHGGTGAISDWLLDLSGETGQLKLNTYGSETHTGTAAYQLAVDANGNVIETTDGGGNVSGGGTNGKITKWSGANGLTDSSFLSESGTTLTNTATLTNFSTNNATVTLSAYGRLGVGTNSATSPFISYLADNSTWNGDHALIRAFNGGNRGARGHSSGSNLLKLDFNDACAMIVNKDGSVGIGTTSPSYELHVVGSSYSSVRLGVQALNTSYIATLGGTTNNKLVLTGSSQPLIRFQEGTTDKAYIQWDSNEGLTFRNQEADNFNFIPDADGSVALRLQGADHDNWGSFYAEEGTSPAHEVGILDADQHWAAKHVNDTSWDFRINNGSKMFINSDGNVGIGTNNPGTLLHVYQDSSSSLEVLFENDGAGQSGLTLRSDRGSNGNLIGFVYFDGNDNGNNNTRYNSIESYIVDSSNGAEDGRLTASSLVDGTDTEILHVMGHGGEGRVAINTTTPKSRLHVDGDMRIGNGNKVYLYTSNDVNYLAYNKWQVNTSTALAINNAGTGGFQIQDNGTTVLFVGTDSTYGGRVGIGTTGPSQKLDVNGTAYFRDDIYFGNTVLNPASGFSNQTGMGWDKSTGQLQIAANGTAALEIGRHTSTGTVFSVRYASTQKASIDTSGNMSLSGTLTEASSLAIKENIEDFTPRLDIINKIRPVKYNKKKESKKEIGLIAEELAELFPELVEKDKNGNPSGVNYSRAVTVLLGGFKELYKEVQELKKRI